MVQINWFSFSRRCTIMINLRCTMLVNSIIFVQDLLLIDRSLIMRRANLIDRHREMRLDVDNMSYEVSTFLMIIFLSQNLKS